MTTLWVLLALAVLIFAGFSAFQRSERQRNREQFLMDYPAEVNFPPRTYRLFFRSSESATRVSDLTSEKLGFRTVVTDNGTQTLGLHVQAVLQGAGVPLAYVTERANPEGDSVLPPGFVRTSIFVPEEVFDKARQAMILQSKIPWPSGFEETKFRNRHLFNPLPNTIAPEIESCRIWM